MFLYNWRLHSGKSSDGQLKLDKDNRSALVLGSPNDSLSDTQKGNLGVTLTLRIPKQSLESEANLETPTMKVTKKLKNSYFGMVLQLLLMGMKWISWICREVKDVEFLAGPRKQNIEAVVLVIRLHFQIPCGEREAAFSVEATRCTVNEDQQLHANKMIFQSLPIVSLC